MTEDGKRFILAAAGVLVLLGVVYLVIGLGGDGSDTCGVASRTGGIATGDYGGIGAQIVGDQCAEWEAH